MLPSSVLMLIPADEASQDAGREWQKTQGVKKRGKRDQKFPQKSFFQSECVRLEHQCIEKRNEWTKQNGGEDEFGFS
ncbi:hypothetical protein GGQ77_003066 [Geobacillus thermodenitrificans]|nr:hypothetical protein [Geobacillus thermodenitrificans]